MELATFNNGKVDVNGKTVTIVVAIVSIIPALVTACTQLVLAPSAQNIMKTVETAKIDLERRKAKAELYRQALANPEAIERQKSLRFLVSARLIEDESNAINDLPLEQIPHWPPPP